MILYVLLFLIVLPLLLVILYKSSSGPNKIEQTQNAVKIYFDNSPGPLDFYLNVVFSLSNFTKPGFLAQGKRIPRFEVICKDATIPDSKLQKFIKACGFDEKTKEIPIAWPFATSLPITFPILTHPKYPMKAMASIVHMKQTIDLIKPIGRDELISKRGVFEGGNNTDRGTEFDVITEVYTSSNQNKETYVGKGTSSFLIVKRKKKSETKTEEAPSQPELPPISLTKTFKVPEPTGRIYAAASGDYNPWHLYPFTAKIFGFRRAIAQGFWSANKCLAEIKDVMPKYPIHVEVEWKRPLFMPSTVTLTTRGSGDKIYFELTSEDKQHTHVVGYVEHVPNMKIDLA